MSSAFARMRDGELYDPGEPDLVAIRVRAQAAMRDYNATLYGQAEARRRILGELLGEAAPDAVIRPPFYVDYGVNIAIETGAFLNYGCVVLDVCPVRIGAKTQIGPYVQILAADHPRDRADRDAGLECGRPVEIGRNVWIGGGALLLPGIRVGDDAIVGAGAVVTRDVAAGQTVAGNPARPLARAPAGP